MKYITTLFNNEDIVKDACKGFTIFLIVMATYGCEEVIGL